MRPNRAGVAPKGGTGHRCRRQRQESHRDQQERIAVQRGATATHFPEVHSDGNRAQQIA